MALGMVLQLRIIDLEGSLIDLVELVWETLHDSIKL